jgi:hypothetical protein
MSLHIKFKYELRYEIWGKMKTKKIVKLSWFISRYFIQLLNQCHHIINDMKNKCFNCPVRKFVVGFAPEPVWTLWGREKSVSSTGNRTPTFQPVATDYTDWATFVEKLTVTKSSTFWGTRKIRYRVGKSSHWYLFCAHLNLFLCPLFSNWLLIYE